MSKPTWARYADVFQASKAPHWKEEKMEDSLVRAKAAFERRLFEVQLMRVPENEKPTRQKALNISLTYYRKMLEDIEKVMVGVQELPPETEFSADGKKIGILK